MNGKSGNHAGGFLLSRVTPRAVPKEFFSTYILNAVDANALRLSAHDDARRYTYNALASFISGLHGLHSQDSVWSITKMYYTAFYVGRATLSRLGIVIFHVPKESGKGHTQYEIKAAVGQQATIVDKTPSTHKLVAERFQKIGYPPFMRSLQVDGLDPIMWLMEQREYWQYRAGKFPDPETPEIFGAMDMTKTQQLLTEYAADTNGVYLADPTHALVAIPFRMLTWILGEDPLISPGIVDPEDIAYLRRRCRVGGNLLTAMASRLPQ